MPHYLVRIELQIGEYEKDTNVLVEAPDSDLAEVFALSRESHGHARLENDGGLVWWDMFGEMAYTVYRITEVGDSALGTLKGLGFHVHHYNEDGIRELLEDPKNLDEYLLNLHVN